MNKSERETPNSVLTHVYGIWKDGNDDSICQAVKETQM